MGIGNHNFDAQSHRQLYDKIHGGPGHAAAQAVDDAWNDFRAVMGNAKAELTSAGAEAGASWIGAAGERFTAGNAPLVQWAEDARAAGVETHNSFLAQTSHYSGAVTGMPEPVEVTSTANDDYWGVPAGFTHLVGGQTDQDVQEQRAQEAKREAVRVMNDYRDGASAAVDSLGAFTPPPAVTARVVEPATAGQPEAQRHQQHSPHVAEHRWGTTNPPTDRGTPVPDGQPVPPAVAPIGGDTGTSGVTTPSDAAARPAPVPVPPPQHAPPPPPAAAPFAPGPMGPSPLGTRNPPAGARGTRGFGGTPGGGAPGGRGSGGPGGGPRWAGGTPGQPGHGADRPLGPGTSSGIGGARQPTDRPGAGTPAARGGTGGPVAGGPAGAPQRGRDEDDLEHRTAPYLEELEDVWGQDDVPAVAPPVIGDDHR
ncbi:PPE domain-containing protein [Saccharothrix syringae]|uniref:PPE domain-containing protein n=1 Tax=Saccharothrix syringae TaxID=103733 RepID=A0A5Q0GU28_SACSY|nr:PPE domain-containing protein [Saccharothrix syringae]QFZ17596.1 PPE domain-containing protein [Saccharothrix syringae]